MGLPFERADGLVRAVLKKRSEDAEEEFYSRLFYFWRHGAYESSLFQMYDGSYGDFLEDTRGGSGKAAAEGEPDAAEIMNNVKDIIDAFRGGE